MWLIAVVRLPNKLLGFGCTGTLYALGSQLKWANVWLIYIQYYDFEKSQAFDFQ